MVASVRKYDEKMVDKCVLDLLKSFDMQVYIYVRGLNYNSS